MMRHDETSRPIGQEVDDDASRPIGQDVGDGLDVPGVPVLGRHRELLVRLVGDLGLVLEPVLETVQL